MRISTKKLLAFMIVAVLVLPILTVALTASAATEKTFVLDANEHLPDMAQGAKKDGESEKVGTDNYFTLYYAGKTKIDTSKKTFSDGYNSAGAAIRRINLQTKTTITPTKISAAIGFSITGSSTVKIWWVQGGDDNRRIALYDADGNIVDETSVELAKNDPCITTFYVDDAGGYFIGSPDGSNYIFRIEVTEHEYVNLNAPVDWEAVETPTITFATDIGGAIKVDVNAQVGKFSGGEGIYADKVTVKVEGGNVHKVYEASSVADSKVYSAEISPEWSGSYTVTAILSREGAEDKVSEAWTVNYVLPLGTPYLSSATSKGDGKVELEFTEVREADKYEIYCDGSYVGETTDLIYMVTGLAVGSEHTFAVHAIRGDESSASDTVEVTVTKDAMPTWGFTYYGPSTNKANNGYTGNLNEDGQVTVYSEGGKGKIQLTSTDGIAFYYTKVPTDQNFTLRATVKINNWTLSNGQEGFGLMVTDRLGKAGDGSNFWNNQYMAGTTKIEYKYESDEDGNEYFYETSYQGGTKYTMKLGLGMVSKTGITKDNLAGFEGQDTEVINKYFRSQILPLETGAAGFQAGTYNAIAGCTNEADLENNLTKLLDTFILEIQRNNTGYFIRYYDTNGNLLREIKNYDPKALDQLDSEFVYAGFFAARNARATFSNVEFTTIDPALDAPAEERPMTLIAPEVVITSPTSSTSDVYTFAINTNVDGTVTIKDYMTGAVIVPETPIKGKERLYLDVQFTEGYREYDFEISFDPDDNQEFDDEYTKLAHGNNVNQEHSVLYTPGNYHRKNVYVSPTGTEYGNGSREYPFDLETAIRNANPGQTIILTEGTYLFNLEGQTLKIDRGIDGTADAPIRMVADPEAKTRPVIDFGGEGFGFTHGGNYWYFEGFDVTGSAGGQKGFQISGNYNTLVDIHAYRNGNTGIQISRYSGTDYTIEHWPSYNLVLNCDSYYNADPGYEDADGFAAKLTCGPGNVFDGCVAYNNADDGWDLYAKVETGPIGSVTIKNCVAYRNGYLEDGRAGGNGNGFKLGGSSISGHHVLINSISFNNLTKGIDSNSCPDVEVYNCISFNNGNYNVAFYTNDVANTAFKASGIISIRTESGADENLKGKGTQVESDYINETNFYWLGGVCQNSKGVQLDPTKIFVSLEFDFEAGVGRNADGTIDLGDFLKIKSGSVPAGVGTTGESTPSPKLTFVADLECTYSETWYNNDVNYHWHACECGNRIDIGEHTFEYVIDKEATETESGSKHNECTVCGNKKAQITIPPIGSEPQQPPVEEPTEEPSGFAAIWQAIVEFFANIVDWFKNLFGGKKV